MSSNHLTLSPSSPASIFPASGSFPMSQLIAPGGQSIGGSASASVLSMSIQGWFPLGLTGLISLQSKGLSKRVFSNTTVRKHQFFSTQPSLFPNSHRIETFLFSLYLVDPTSTICLSQRLIHTQACMVSTMQLQRAHWISYSFFGRLITATGLQLVTLIIV